ncbi:hypothetical protein Cpir12675_006830 [Ceratocystis pirilliformis]|uniref:Uncharacterized protein n=1 Tax=Ceratocystis pirilliformis TaxID=259994 RepID=A0ABR3YF85_9PEZI
MTSSQHSTVGQGMMALLSDPEIVASKALHIHGGKVTLNVEVVDPSDMASIDRFTRTINERHHRELDFIVNSMGLMLNSFGEQMEKINKVQRATNTPFLPDSASVQATIAHDIDGLLAICNSFSPHMRPNTGHIILPGHEAESFSYFPPTCASLFLNSRTLQDIQSIMQTFAYAAMRGVVIDEGWVPSARSMSKAATTTLARVLALENEFQRNKVLFSAASTRQPIETRITRFPFEEMAQMAVSLVLSGCGGQSGGLWDNSVATFR